MTIIRIERRLDLDRTDLEEYYTISNGKWAKDFCLCARLTDEIKTDIMKSIKVQFEAEVKRRVNETR